MGRNVCVCNWLQVIVITLSYGLGGVKSICGVLWKAVGYWSFLEMVFLCRSWISPTSHVKAAWQGANNPRGFLECSRNNIGLQALDEPKRGDSQLNLPLMISLGLWRLLAALADVAVRWQYVRSWGKVRQVLRWLNNSCNKEDGAKSSWRRVEGAPEEMGLFEFQSWM